MRATDGQLIAANATGCLEVFSTPYPETSWQLPWIHSLFGNAPAVATGDRRGAARPRAATDIRVDRPGRRRRHRRHRLRLPVGDVRAQRRRALRLLRQRGLHEHRACSAPAPRRRPRARRRRRPSAPQPGNVVRPGQERAADRDGARDPLRRHRDGRRPARPRGQGRARDGDARRALHPRARHLPARLGLRRRARPIQVARLAKETGLFPVFEAEDGEVTERLEDPPAGAGRGVPASRSAATRTCSSPSAATT